MHTSEPVSTREATERIVKIIESSYVKAHLEHVASDATHINGDKRAQLIGLLKKFEECFGGTLGEWDTELTNLELKPYYKPFNCKHYPVPITDKDTLRKVLQ